MSQTDSIRLHYERDDLTRFLAEALAAAGLADRKLSPADLAPLDQFHTRGLAATVELAEAIGIERGAAVIDIGSGLGGPSRYLAANYRAHVRGIDLSASFVAAATYLAERAGLDSLVQYDCGNALALPYADASFDLAWTQHVAMNIADRAGLYAEIHRVLRPGGRFAIYDVVAGNGEPVHYPAPWSRGPETSFLVTPSAMRATLETQGFHVTAWEDRTAAGVAWFEAQRLRGPAPQPALGLHLAMGPDFPAMAANLGRNLREGRVGLVQAVLARA